MVRSSFVQSLAVALGAAAMVAVAGCARSSDSSLFAADAHASPLAAAPAAPPSTGAPASDLALGPMPSLAPLVKAARPVVVNISTTVKAKLSRGRRFGRNPHQQPFGQSPDDEEGGGEDPMERFFRFFGPGGPQGNMRQPERHGLGSGFTIGDGLVLTNNHVIDGADEIKVTTDPSAPGGMREYVGKVIGRDASTDVALVQLQGDRAKDLPAAQLGSSDALEVGDYVVAIGEPFGFQATVTSGIVSAKERSLRASAFDDFIQTDASINPGNSGGPLFNMRGEVVGVNTAIISGANSIGFAIPIDLVKQELPQLRTKGRVVRGYLGVGVQPVSQDVAESFGLKTTEGALVAEVRRDSPAAKAGLKPGDVIHAVDGKPIRDERHLTRTISAFSPGAQVKLDVFRDKGDKSLEVTVGKRPDESDEEGKGQGGESGEEKGSDPLGLQVETLTPEMARRAQVESGTKGAVVTDVAPDSPAGQSLEPGDVIVEVNRHPIESATDYRRAVKTLKKGDTALLRTLSRGGARYQSVRIK
jgi:serine protease Do